MAVGPGVELNTDSPSDGERLVATVNRVIDQRAVTTLFQPLVDLATTEVVGYEALSRGPEGSEVESPLALLQGAVLAGRLAELDWLCAARACDAVIRARLHPWTTIFLNLKPVTVLTTCPPDLLPSVRAGQDNLRIVVEMDEDALSDDPGTLFDAVRAVRSSGWGISIDNAAARPAVLALLPLVRPDVLKLDFRGTKGRLSEIAQMGEGPGRTQNKPRRPSSLRAWKTWTMFGQPGSPGPASAKDGFLAAPAPCPSKRTCLSRSSPWSCGPPSSTGLPPLRSWPRCARWGSPPETSSSPSAGRSKSRSTPMDRRACS